MRSAVLALLSALAACEQPAATKAPPTPTPTPAPAPAPPPDPYASMPQCRAQCEDRMARERCDPPNCTTLESCMGACREPSPTP